MATLFKWLVDVLGKKFVESVLGSAVVTAVISYVVRQFKTLSWEMSWVVWTSSALLSFLLLTRVLAKKREIAGGNTADPPVPYLIIHRAKYGIGEGEGQHVDTTEALRDEVRETELRLPVFNETLKVGNPFKGRRKRLWVTYSITQKVEVEESGELSLPPHRMRRTLQVDPPDYVANGEWQSSQPDPPFAKLPTGTNGRIIVDVTDRPEAQLGDLYDPKTGAFSKPRLIPKEEKPYPKVEIWRHEASSREQADIIRNLFSDGGWEVDDSHTTNLPQHASGITICGGTSFDRSMATWGLQTHRLKAEAEHRNDPPEHLQIIIGAIDSSKQQTLGEWSVQQMAVQRDAALQAAETCQKSFAAARLRWLADKAETNKAEVRVKVRFADYQDYELVKRIEGVFREHAPKWPVEIDGTNQPVLKPADDYKVVFDCGFMQAYMEAASAFSDGNLAGASVGMRRTDRFSEGNKGPELIVEVLPTVRKT